VTNSNIAQPFREAFMGSTSQVESAESLSESTRHSLRVKLDRLMRVKEELWEECLPIPPELDAKIVEVCKALGLE
jgi:hypothetical protein